MPGELSKVDAVLQETATISKTTETLMGAAIDCKGYSFITLFFRYVKGDETGLNIYPYFLNNESAIEHQDQSWTSAAGTKTFTANLYQLAATGNHFITFDIRGVSQVKFYQGGSTNDGTPTGTLAAQYTLSDE